MSYPLTLVRLMSLHWKGYSRLVPGKVRKCITQQQLALGQVAIHSARETLDHADGNVRRSPRVDVGPDEAMMLCLANHSAQTRSVVTYDHLDTPANAGIAALR